MQLTELATFFPAIDRESPVASPVPETCSEARLAQGVLDTVHALERGWYRDSFGNLNGFTGSNKINGMVWRRHECGGVTRGCRRYERAEGKGLTIANSFATMEEGVAAWRMRVFADQFSLDQPV